jgi:succinyl-diaminopimelate desuccinylase
MSHDLKEIFDKIESYKKEMIYIQKELTAIPAISPDYEEGEGEMKKSLFLEEYIKKQGFTDIIHYDAPDDRVKEKMRPNFAVKLKGKNPDRKFWIMAHMDVVPPGDMDQWKGDPWKMRVEGDIMIGRGTEDNQQGLVSGLFALKALKDLDIQPEYDTYLILVSDEESGSKFGIKYILTNEKIFGKDDIIIVPDAGEADSAMIEVAEKSIIWMKIDTTGKQCHGSTPELGINAHRASAHLITELDELYKKYNKKDSVYEPPISTFEPTMKEANVGNINTIPGNDTVYYDCRILPEYNTDDILEYVRKKADKIENKFNVKIEISTPQHVKAAPPTPTNAPVVKILKKAIKEVYNVEANPKGIGGGTVASHFRQMGLNVAVWSTILDLCHQPEEAASIKFMVNDTKVLAYSMIQKV